MKWERLGLAAHRITFRSIEFPLGLILVASALWFAARTIHWPLAGDTSLMHYVVFMSRHGLVPYKDIGDMNLPGCYLPDFLVTKLFGASDLAWRFYDFALLGAIAAAFFAIAKPIGKFPAVWAACLFAVIHGRDGVDQAGQRDLTAAALLLVGIAFLFWAIRRGQSWSAGLWGLLAGSAAMVKPTLAPFVLLTLVELPHRIGLHWKRRVGIAFSAWLMAPLLCGLGLLSAGALGPFWYAMRVLAPYHASLGHASWGTLLHNAASPLSLIVVLWLLALACDRLGSANRPQRTHTAVLERRILLLAAALGLLSYVLQRKAFPYHRYPFLAFLLLAIALDLAPLLQGKQVAAWLSAALFLWTSIVVVPSSVLKASRYDGQHHEVRSMLEADLAQYERRENLSTVASNVQCLDTTSGCIAALQQLGIPQKSGFLYDEFLFHAGGTRAVDDTRASFLKTMQAGPPLVFIVTDPLFPTGPDHYAKLKQWPEFDDWLNANYRLEAERQPAIPVRAMGRSIVPSGYRLYTRSRP